MSDQQPHLAEIKLRGEQAADGREGKGAECRTAPLTRRYPGTVAQQHERNQSNVGRVEDVFSADPIRGSKPGARIMQQTYDPAQIA